MAAEKEKTREKDIKNISCPINDQRQSWHAISYYVVSCYWALNNL